MSRRIQYDGQPFQFNSSDVPPSTSTTQRVFAITPTEGFKEINREVIDADEYARNGTDPGLVIIFNQVNFKNGLGERLGSDKDVEALIHTFLNLGFNVEQEKIFTDKTRKNILDNIATICMEEENLKNRNCLICIFLSHGESENILYASDGVLKVHEIINPFAECHALQNKPKFFIFQACKHKDTSDNRVKFVSNDIFDSMQDDVLVSYSTLEGHPSIREEENGSWFIQELCRNISAYGRRDDVVSLIMRTTKCVTKNRYFEKCENSFEKQVPIFVSTLTKKFYLTVSKDRARLLQTIRQYETILEAASELHTQLTNVNDNRL